MVYQSINDYGLIGDCHSAALVSRDGSIDWLCFPRFDSPSLFAAILDNEKGGNFLLSPETTYISSQSYVGETNVLYTRFDTEQGACTVTDCMPLYLDEEGATVAGHQVIRLVRGIRGTVPLRVIYSPRPDYGQQQVNLAVTDGLIVWAGFGAEFSLLSPVALQLSGDLAEGRLNIREGQEVAFVLSYHDEDSNQSELQVGPREQVNRTLAYWTRVVQDTNYAGPWRDVVIRSYLTLQLMVHLPTGGIVAAPTTSLPEEIGGERNWDYRYTWLRDAAFTGEALVSLGGPRQGLSFLNWLVRVCPRDGSSPQCLYGVDGERQLAEIELTNLAGHHGSKPVRIGNDATSQAQHDIYGEVLAFIHLTVSQGLSITDEQWEVVRYLANLAAEKWQEPDNSIWEVRSGPYDFVYSKVMCWVALDRAAALADTTGRNGKESETWRLIGAAIKAEVLRRGWNEEKQAFVQHYDTDAMDASLLLMPIVGFLPFEDPRIVSTVQRIRQELSHGLLLHRYRTEETDDGLQGEQGAFTLCSFWLIRVLAGMGEWEEAQRIFEELLDYSNHLGLLAEMVDPGSGAPLGNFPQAFSHLGLALAALELTPDLPVNSFYGCSKGRHGDIVSYVY